MQYGNLSNETCICIYIESSSYEIELFILGPEPMKVSPRPPCEISDEAPIVAAQTVQMLWGAFEAIKWYGLLEELWKLNWDRTIQIWYEKKNPFLHFL